MMTRKELESLGGSDEDLAARAKKLLKVDILEALKGPDDETKQRVRGSWFSEVTAWEQNVSVKVEAPPIGSYAQDDPEEHHKATGGVPPPKPKGRS